MKNHKSLLVSALFTLFFLFQISYSQVGGRDCYPVTQTCPDQWTTGLSRNVELPGYQGCQITVYYDKKVCPNPNCSGKSITYLNITGFGFNYDDPDCMGLTYCIFPDYPDMPPYRLQCILETIENCFRQLSEDLFEEFYNNLDPSLRVPYKCSGNPCTIDECAEGSFAFFKPKCISMCMWADEQNHRMIYRWDACASQPTICCKMFMAYCYCESTGQFLSYEDSEQLEGNCNGAQPPTSSCPTGATQFECYFSCSGN